jgi:hypothetical protein
MQKVESLSALYDDAKVVLKKFPKVVSRLLNNDRSARSHQPSQHLEKANALKQMC